MYSEWIVLYWILYLEAAVVLLFILPFSFSETCASHFRLKLLKSLRKATSFCFLFYNGILLVLFMHAALEMRKYFRKDAENEKLAVDILSRAGSNFYVSSFALLLSLVIRRFVDSMFTQAVSIAESRESKSRKEFLTKSRVDGRKYE